MQELNVEKVRKDFPILNRLINGKPLVYFDNAATSQKPLQVITAVKDYYENHNANVHRGLHVLSSEATALYEDSHAAVANFIGVSPQEIIFTRNATEAINLVAYSWGLENIKAGDEIVVTQMEHHSNLVPWQQLAKLKGAKVVWWKVDENGMLDRDVSLINRNTKLVALAHVSNVLGTVNPVSEIASVAHDFGAVVMLDGAQSVPHMSVDVKELDCDFLAFSGHKMCGPTGVGVLFGKKELLSGMKPFLFGGDMIKEVAFDHATWNDLPWKFEAGTPNIAGGVGLHSAINYLKSIGMENIQGHEAKLTKYAMERMKELKQVKFFGPSIENRGGIISFNLGDVHPHDLATVLDQEGIAIRAGHHCAQPLMGVLGVNSTSRASFYFYNSKEEVDVFINALDNAAKVFKLK